MFRKTHKNPRHLIARVIVILILLGGLSLELVFFAREKHGLSQTTSIDMAALLEPCRSLQEKSEALAVNECILDVVKKALIKEDLSSAYGVFEVAYRTFPEFSEGSCHNQAHRVGDMFYYNYFLAQGKDLSRFEYPQVTTACGYGFFHGLFEHLAQDHPDPAYITNACEYLRERLSKDMSDIGTICYHGSGHGFVLANADKIPRDKWGDIQSFVGEPVRLCDALPKASIPEREDCKAGIFNVILIYMEDKNYGFVYPEKDPLGYCDPLPLGQRRACLFEMAQKLDRVSGYDPVKLYQIAARAGDDEEAQTSFSVGIAGIVQHYVNDGNGYESTLTACLKLNDQYLDVCVRSIIHGLFEHGDPLLQYKKPLHMCSDVRIGNRRMTKSCYENVMVGIRRYFGEEKRKLICDEFPENARQYCVR